ncbi:hypothetical protein LTS09_006829 [Friedmanniomyces endolithicus]|nr:hypothetical protein LTS09_006829 [Friedmanniomyces endolithicus]
MYPYMMQQRAYQRAYLRQMAGREAALEEQAYRQQAYQQQTYQQQAYQQRMYQQQQAYQQQAYQQAAYQRQVFMERTAEALINKQRAEYHRRFGGGDGEESEPRGRDHGPSFHGFVESESLHSSNEQSRARQPTRDTERSERYREAVDHLSEHSNQANRGRREAEVPRHRHDNPGPKVKRHVNGEEDYSEFLFPHHARADFERRRQATEDAAKDRREEQKREDEAMREAEMLRRDARRGQEGGREPSGCGTDREYHRREPSRGYDTEEIRPSPQRRQTPRRGRYDDEEEEMLRGCGHGGQPPRRSRYYGDEEEEMPRGYGHGGYDRGLLSSAYLLWNRQPDALRSHTRVSLVLINGRVATEVDQDDRQRESSTS